MKHTEETKRKALESMAEIGVKKTQEKMKISPQTLYKWRNEQSEATPPPADDRVAVAKEAVRGSNEYLLEKIVQVEAENAKLRATMENLKKALLVFIEQPS